MLLITALNTAGLILSVNVPWLYAAENYQVNRVSSGKIAYDTFGASNGTSTDIPWTFMGEGWTVEDGKLRAGEGNAYPADVNVTDFIWELKTKTMAFVQEGPEMRVQMLNFHVQYLTIIIQVVN